VISDRALRIRRGIWIIHETTITFENIQNVSISQGPVQRWFGIADVLVETAGGGGGAQKSESPAMMLAHKGLIEGVGDAQRIRDRLLTRLKKSRASGLGDEDHRSSEPMWTEAHLTVLREIRDALSRRWSNEAAG